MKLFMRFGVVLKMKARKRWFWKQQKWLWSPLFRTPYNWHSLTSLTGMATIKKKKQLCMCACAYMHTPTSLSVGVYVSMSQSESENNLGCVFLPSTLFDTGSLTQNCVCLAGPCSKGSDRVLVSSSHHFIGTPGLQKRPCCAGFYISSRDLNSVHFTHRAFSQSRITRVLIV